MRLATSVTLVLTALFATASIAPAQQRAGSDTIERLLDEVHALRLALERQSTTGAAVQLATGRLALQDQRVYRLSEQLENARRELMSIDRQTKEFAAREKEMDDMLSVESDPQRRMQVEMALKMFKAEQASQASLQESLRVREQDLMNALAFEQAKLDDITRKLDDLEFALRR
jgi:hypothetical protein